MKKFVLLFSLVLVFGVTPRTYATSHMCFQQVDTYGNDALRMLELELASKISIAHDQIEDRVQERLALSFKLRRKCDNANLKLVLEELKKQNLVKSFDVKTKKGKISLDMQFVNPLRTRVHHGLTRNVVTLVFSSPSMSAKDKYYKHQMKLLIADRALQKQRYDDAIQLLEGVLAEISPNSAIALEKLGVARERNGQQAQAASLYRRFLDEYPKDENIVRVRQRLSGLLNNQLEVKAPIVALNPIQQNKPGQKKVYGALNQMMLVTDRRGLDANGLEQAMVLSGINLGSRMTDKRKMWRFDMAVDQRYDLVNRAGEGVEFNDVFFEYRNSGTGLKAGGGRHRGLYGGMFGKYDGAYLEYALGSRLAMAVAGGFPVRFDSKDRIQYEKYVNTASLIYRRNGWQVQPYGAYQRYNNVTGRAALGEEIAFSDQNGFVRQALDYDVYFEKLNLISIQGNYRFFDKLTTYFTAEMRRSPMLEIENAMIGEFRVDEFSTLQEIIEIDEIKRRAELYSSISEYYNAGAEYAFPRQLSIKLDVFRSIYSYRYRDGEKEVKDSDANTDVYASVSKRQIYKPWNDGVDLGVRYTISRNSTNYRFNFRYSMKPVTSFVIDQNVIASVRVSHSGEESYILRPVIKFNYQWQKTVWNQLELGYEWQRNRQRPENNFEQAVFNLVYRYAF
ncbi:MAG: tetratricopeptide repeat protein [Gammaproteobacteria bacterium]|nr:tetratricopeptide repeat protein [Gammaproteobacteria bacterium]